MNGIEVERQGGMKEPGRASLIAAAKAAAARAYAPYSRFKVGAALLTKSGKVFTGSNVENASYGLSVCAERVAIFKAVADGEREFDTLVVYSSARTLTAPCGACRQVMTEFAPKLRVILANRSGRTRTYRLEQLLPVRFSL